MPNLVDRWGPQGYEPSGGPERPNPLGMLPAWLIELVLGRPVAPPAPPPVPPMRPDALRGINGMLTPRRPYFEHFPSPRVPPRG